MLKSIVAVALLILSPVLRGADVEKADENAVIKAVVERQFTKHLPYVKKVVVASETLPLDRVRGDAWPSDAIADYSARNEQPLELTMTALRNRVSVADVPPSATWDQFADEHGDAWLVRVARPAFESADVAFVRIDVADPEMLRNSSERAILAVQFKVERTAEGWRAVSGTSRIHSARDAAPARPAD